MLRSLHTERFVLEKKTVCSGDSKTQVPQALYLALGQTEYHQVYAKSKFKNKFP